MAGRALRLDGVVAGYGDGTVLQGTDLEVGAGERLGLLGRNGAGKTTLMRVVMGLLPARSGTLRFGEDRLDRLPTFEIARRGIAYVPQGRELFGDFSVGQNLELGGAGRPGRADVDLALEAFPWLKARWHEPAGSLSGGQQQQLAIARALVSRPELMLLDEPLEGIQPSVVDEIAQVLLRFCARESIGMLLAEQNTEVVLGLCERVVFIDGGRIVASASSTSLRADRAPIDRHLGL